MQFVNLKERCDALAANFVEITTERKQILDALSQIIRQKIADGNKIQLVYICTHNSRRSHLGQVWAATAAAYYKVNHVTTFSGGTEATAFNHNAIKALERSGFIVEKQENNHNPKYQVFFGENQSTICFSKKFDDQANPRDNFIAVMTCSDADENCPYIPGCDARIGTTYNDPKAYDNTIMVDEKYMERSNQIALESLYVFSNIRDK